MSIVTRWSRHFEQGDHLVLTRRIFGKARGLEITWLTFREMNCRSRSTRRREPARNAIVNYAAITDGVIQPMRTISISVQRGVLLHREWCILWQAENDFPGRCRPVLQHTFMVRGVGFLSFAADCRSVDRLRCHENERRPGPKTWRAIADAAARSGR